MIFDFVKNAGEKMMNFFSNDAANETKSKKITDFINKLELTAEGLNVQVDDATATIMGNTSTSEMKEKIILAVGNVEGISKVEDKMTVTENTQTTAQFYTVKSGDTLSKISKEFYKDAMKYNTIFEANKPMLANPDKIYPGQTLRIPNL
jgi:nucleoid-associated protein YgaU